MIVPTIVVDFDTGVSQPKQWLVDKNDRECAQKILELQKQTHLTDEAKKEKKKRLEQERVNKNVMAVHNIPVIKALLSFYGNASLILTTNNSFFACRGFVENISHITRDLVCEKDSAFGHLKKELDPIRYTIFKTSVSKDGCRMDAQDPEYLQSLKNVYGLEQQPIIYFGANAGLLNQAIASRMTAINSSLPNALEALKQIHQRMTARMTDALLLTKVQSDELALVS